MNTTCRRTGSTTPHRLRRTPTPAAAGHHHEERQGNGP
jgi:hypothetical protein